MRRLRGDAADWDLHAALLALIEYRLAGANWQRSGGKGQKPKPIKIPGSDTSSSRRSKPKRERNADAVRRLQNLGLIPDTGS